MADSSIARVSSILGSAYVVERELRGGMSRVVVARDVALGRRVVVKMLPADWAAGVSVERFRREVVMAAALQHPHIVPLLAASEAADGTLFYTMPYVDGESLRNRLAESIPPVAQSLRWLRDVASALAYAHARGIVHRDMKPDNILLSGGYALVVDFGIAKALTNASATLSGLSTADQPITTIGTSIGTPAYMAPEQVAADADADYRADLYALGVIAYELLTGETPFKGTPQAILVAHLATEPEPLDKRRGDLPEALCDLVMGCLAKNAADRPATAAGVVSTIEDLLRTMSATDSAPTPATWPRPSARGALTDPDPRTAQYAKIAAAGVVVVAMAGAWALWSGLRTPATIAHRVAVATLRDTSPDSSLRDIARAIAGDIASDLSLLDGSDVVERDEVERTESALVADRFVVEALAKPLRAGLVVAGDVSAMGADSVRIRVALVSGVDGRTIRSLRDVHTLRSDVRAATEMTRQRLAGAVSAIIGSDFSVAMLPAGEPPTLAALLAVRDGLHLEASLRLPDPGEDEALAELARFDRAADADPEYAQALLWFASAALRRPGGEVLADSALALVQTQLRQLTEYERALLDALRADVSGNHELSVRGWRRARLLAPAWPNRWWLAMKLRDANRPREALAILDSLGSENAHFRRSEPGLRHYLKDFAGEHRALRHERQRAPSTAQSVGFQQALLQSLSALDSLVMISTLLDQASQLPAEPGTSLAYLLVRTSWELGAHGHTRASASTLQRAVSWCDRRTAADLANQSVAFDCMEAYGYAGQVAPLSALAEPALRARAEDIDIAILGVLGLAAAINGEREAAEAYAVRIERGTRVDGSHGLASWLRARIAAAMGDPLRAIELMEDAFARGAGWSQRMDLHRDPAFTALRGVAGFERLRQPQG